MHEYVDIAIEVSWHTNTTLETQYTDQIAQCIYRIIYFFIVILLYVVLNQWWEWCNYEIVTALLNVFSPARRSLILFPPLKPMSCYYQSIDRHSVYIPWMETVMSYMNNSLPTHPNVLLRLQKHTTNFARLISSTRMFYI